MTYKEGIENKIVANPVKIVQNLAFNAGFIGIDATAPKTITHKARKYKFISYFLKSKSVRQFYYPRNKSCLQMKLYCLNDVMAYSVI